MRPSKIKSYFNIVDHHKVGPYKEYRYFSFLESGTMDQNQSLKYIVLCIAGRWYNHILSPTIFCK